MPAWLAAPRMRWYAFRFLWRVSWKTDEPPCLSSRVSYLARVWNPDTKYIPSNDDRVSEEEDPDTVPAVAVRLNDLVLVADPVLVPAPKCSGIVNSENVNVLDLKACRFHLKRVHG